MVLEAIPFIHRRQLLAAAAALAATGARGEPSPCPPPRVLFVCPYGTVKSAIARETLRRRAGERDQAVQVQSRGLRLENHVTPQLAANLHADGLDPLAEPPRVLIDSDVRAADIVIAFDEAAGAPQLDHARVWTTPSFVADYAGAKAALATWVESLLDELARRGCAPTAPGRGR
jgi:protein-tyrosine-phosphatase